MIIFFVALGVGISTILGSGIGLLVREIPHRFNDAILGAAAGLMLAASILGLILPATECMVPNALLQTVLGVFCGALGISVVDRLTPHLHQLVGVDREEHGDLEGLNRVLLFVTALAIHKLPEGLAVGVSFGTEHVGNALTVAGSIALQNIPEGMVIIAPLLAVGVSFRRTLAISLFIGFIEITGMLLGFSLVAAASVILPFALSFAGGMMLYVISDEMIPETHSHGYEKLATFALLAGFMFVVVADQLMSAI